MIQVADNFNYRGKKPNFDRDSFDTLLEVMEILSIDLLQIDAILVLCILILHQVNLYSIKIILSGQMLQELLYNNKTIKIWHSMQLKMN